jgi:acyl-CoA reductase-like NAD-dependent aldehyde dehydrogenase
MKGLSSSYFNVLLGSVVPVVGADRVEERLHVRFESEAQALQIANDSRFGLAAGIWTNNLQRAHRLAHELDAGTVWINTYRTLTPLSPFGGFKDSGLGKENGADVVRDYTRVKSIWVNLSTEPIADPFVGR